MKPLRKSFFVAGLLLLAAAVAGVAQPRFAHSAATAAAAARTITVNGSGSVLAVPDRASFQFGVTTQAATAQDALAQNSAAAAKVIAALKAAGVASADLQTSGVSLSPQTNADGTKIVGYQAFDSVSAAIALARAGALVDAAVAAGADSVSGPSLTVADQSADYRQALTKAVADAKSKAKTLAGAGGLTLGAVQSISEGTTSTPLPFGAKAAAGDASTPIEAGSQEIDATVTVVYAVS